MTNEIGLDGQPDGSSRKTVLDLFSGTGSATAAFRGRQGHEVVQRG